MRRIEQGLPGGNPADHRAQVWISIQNERAPHGGKVIVLAHADHSGTWKTYPVIWESAERLLVRPPARAWWPSLRTTAILLPDEHEAAEMLLLAGDRAAMEAYVRAAVEREWPEGVR